MGDLWAHKHMRKCCKDTLAKLDQIRDASARAAGQAPAPKGAPTLAGLLGPKKIPEAQLAVHELASSKSPLLQIPASATSARASWENAIKEHFNRHQDSGETREALFWSVLGGMVAQMSTSLSAVADSGATATAPSAGPSAPPYLGMSRFAQQRGFVVTSTAGGRHNPGSAHYDGRAIDVRTNDQSDEAIQQFMNDARAAGLNVRDERTRPAGQVVWSGPHLHLSVPPGTDFP